MKKYTITQSITYLNIGYAVKAMLNLFKKKPVSISADTSNTPSEKVAIKNKIKVATKEYPIQANIQISDEKICGKEIYMFDLIKHIRFERFLVNLDSLKIFINEVISYGNCPHRVKTYKEAVTVLFALLRSGAIVNKGYDWFESTNKYEGYPPHLHNNITWDPYMLVYRSQSIHEQRNLHEMHEHCTAVGKLFK